MDPSGEIPMSIHGEKPWPSAGTSHDRPRGESVAVYRAFLMTAVTGSYPSPSPISPEQISKWRSLAETEHGDEEQQR